MNYNGSEFLKALKTDRDDVKLLKWIFGLTLIVMLAMAAGGFSMSNQVASNTTSIELIHNSLQRIEQKLDKVIQDGR